MSEDNDESFWDNFWKGRIEYVFLFVIFLILITSVLGIFLENYVFELDEDIIYWVCSTIFQGMLALLAFWGAFAIFILQTINTQISNYEMLSTQIGIRKQIVLEKVEDNLIRLRNRKEQVKGYIIRPLVFILLTVFMSLFLLLFNNINFKTDMSTEGMQTTYVLVPIAMTVLSLGVVFRELKNVVKMS